MPIPENYKKESLDQFHLSFIFATIYRQHATYLNHELKEHNITAGEYPIIMKLYKENKKSQNEIAKSFGLTDGTIARTIRHLEDKNIITRETNQENRRQNFVYLTDKGMNVASVIEDIESRWEKIITKKLGTDEYYQFKNTLYDISIDAIQENNKD